MASIVWTWKDFWAFFGSMEDAKNKADVLKQINAQFVRGLSPDRQIEMFEYAPPEIKRHIGHLLHPEALEALNPKKKLRRIK